MGLGFDALRRSAIDISEKAWHIASSLNFEKAELVQRGALIFAQLKCYKGFHVLLRFTT